MLIGISTLLSLGSGCNRETEYKITADLVFINTSEKQINYSNLFTLEPEATKVISLKGDGGDKSSEITTCCQGFLEDYQGSSEQVFLILNNSECLFFEENEGPTNLDNYEQEILGTNNFRYTYVFTDDQFTNAEPCN